MVKNLHTNLHLQELALRYLNVSINAHKAYVLIKRTYFMNASIFQYSLCSIVSLFSTSVELESQNCLSVCLFVCLFVHVFKENRWSIRLHIAYSGSLPPGKCFKIERNAIHHVTRKVIGWSRLRNFGTENWKKKFFLPNPSHIAYSGSLPPGKCF